MSAMRRQKKKKPRFFSFLKIRTATKKRLVRASLLINLALLTLFVFAVRRDGFAVTFQHVGTFISAPLSSLK